MKFILAQNVTNLILGGICAAVVANDQSTNSDSQSEKDLTANPIPLIGEVYTCLKCDKSFSSNFFLNCHMIRKHDPNFTLDT